MQKLVILAAPNGGAQVDREGAIVPCSPKEIAEEAYRCHQAGASVIHFHGRDENKGPTSDLSVYSNVISRIREKCDILIQTTNGIGHWRDPNTGLYKFPPDEERLGLLTIEPKQDLFSLGGGSWDFYHPEGNYKGTTPFINSPEFLKKSIRGIMERSNAAVEFEIVEVSFLYKLARFADEGVFDGRGSRFWLDYCFGFGGMPSTPQALLHALSEGKRLFPQAKWEVVATGKESFAMNTHAMLMGCDIVRVGFEDNIYLPNGKPARYTADLVEAMVRIAREFGREPATVQEARKVFGI